MRETKNQSTCILVVDDDEDICLTLTDQLLAMGYEVYQATNGREALDTFSRKTIDGMLVDIQMPVIDGWTMLAQLHQRHAHIPFVVMSADDPVTTEPKAREYGAQGYLPKPFNFSHVQATCLRVFGELPTDSRRHHCSTKQTSLLPQAAR